MLDLFRKKTFAIPQQPAPLPRKKVGVAFGGGGMKGLAHLGVLKVLAEHQVPIDMVAGTSIGSLIAVLYASGYDWKMLKMLWDSYNAEHLLRVRPSRMGLIPANDYAAMIRTCTKNKQLQEMDIPVKVVAVDLVSRKRILFSAGDPGAAVRASSAIPGIFTPVEMGGMVLVDGYVMDNCPGDVVREMGADVVIAIDLWTSDTFAPKTMVDVVSRALSIATHSSQKIDSDILLSPIEHHINTFDTKLAEDCFLQGETCARAHIDEILQAIQ